MPLWVRKAGAAEGGYCNLTRRVWVPSRNQWLPMDFLESEARRDRELHGRVLPMDSDDFRAHSVGFYQRADQWMGRHSTSLPRAPSPLLKDADMSKHVFAADPGSSDLSTAMTPVDTPELACGLSRPFSSAVVAEDQPPLSDPVTSHFGVRDRRVGGSASRPFWSWSAQPGSQLWALPMQGPFP